MTAFLKLFFVSLILLAITSCGTTNNVSSNHLIQKRKYTRGFHFRSLSTMKNEWQEKNKLDINLIETIKEADEKKTSSSAIVLPTKEKNKSVLFASELNATRNSHSIKSSIKVVVEKSKIKKESEIIGTELKSEEKYDNSAVAGFILGIVSFLSLSTLVITLISLGLAGGAEVFMGALVTIVVFSTVLAIIFSKKGLLNTKSSDHKGRKLAIIGLILGIAAPLISFLSIAIWFVFGGAIL